ncbi:uncharacterized protein LOC142357296, partial [Convolutriloba macropyga]|uniref:uncharacterized protein LOC142357296 n=1 Tax=Convolutriloba macropyga TaxID=536237 RepID=UPI003F51FC18
VYCAHSNFENPDPPPTPEHWESLVFLLTTPLGPFGTLCSNYSNFYCLESYQTTLVGQPDLGLTPAMMAQWFYDLIETRWRTINMISKQEGEDCCEGQTAMYVQYGLRNMAWSPDEYLEKLMDYSNHSMTLNYIQGRYYGPVCANIITEVGFGPGPIRRAADYEDREKPYILISREHNNDEPTNLWSKQFDYDTPQMTFGWFKEQIMCREKPWLCEN